MARIVYETPITVHKDDTFSISFEVGNPEGYDWSAYSYSTVTLTLIANQVADDFRSFTFRARSKGETQLIFNNSHPTEGVLTQREYTVNVPYEREEYRYGPNLLNNAQLEY